MVTEAAGRGTGAAVAGGAATVTMLLLVPLLRLRDATLSVPFIYNGDSMFHGMLVKTVFEHGWYERNPDLGAPAGQVMHDFPIADNFHLFAFKLMGLFTDDFAVATNLYFLIGFPLTAMFAAMVFRRIGISPVVSATLAVLYAFAPYHFVRGTSHLFLASYFVVPLGIWLILGAAREVPLFSTPWKAAATVAMAVVVASASPYYAAFTVLLLAVACAAAAAREGSWRHALPGVVVALVIIAGVGANVAPDVLYAASHGQNETASYRASGDTEGYGLKITQLVLPQFQHRVAALRDVTSRYLHEFPLPSEEHPLGLVAAAGFLGLLGAAALQLVRPRPPDGSSLVPTLALLTVAAVLIATVGGFATLIELMAIPILRGWNRMVIFIAFFSLAAVGVAVDGLGRRFGRRASAAVAAIAVVLLAVGIWDQTSPAFVPPYASLAKQYATDAAFVADIERLLPDQAMVFQLPFVPFPEGGSLFGMVDYDHLHAYLLSNDLRWSYGAMTGRAGSQWAKEVSGQPASAAIPRLTDAGFAGVYVDRAGYADRAATLEAEWGAILGPPFVVSADGRLSFFMLPSAKTGTP